MFNPFKELFREQDQDKDKFCLDYKRGGDFNQARSLVEFIKKLKSESQPTPEQPYDLRKPLIINGRVVYIIFASGDYFSAYHAAKYRGLCSIYFNGTKDKRKKSISFKISRGKKTLTGKIHSWLKNNHSYAVFNEFKPPEVTDLEPQARATPIEEPALDHIKILSHNFPSEEFLRPFDELLLPGDDYLITDQYNYQTIKDTIETAIKICTDNTIDNDVTITNNKIEVTGQSGGDPGTEVDPEMLSRLTFNGPVNPIIEISKEIYENIMALIKFNRNSYINVEGDEENDLDIFSLSKQLMIIEKNGINPWPENPEECLNNDELYTHHTLFDILILYLSHHKLDHGNEKVCTHTRGPYPFKEIYIDDGNNSNYSFYQIIDLVNPNEVTYGYGRYLNSNKVEQDNSDTIIEFINTIIKPNIRNYTGGDTALFNVQTLQKRKRFNPLFNNQSRKRGRYENIRYNKTQKRRRNNNNPNQQQSKRLRVKSNNLQKTHSIPLTKNEFNQFLKDNNIYLSKKLDIILSVIELREYMHEVNNLCSIDFKICDDFIKKPNEEFMVKLSEIKTRFIINEIINAKQKLEIKNNNNIDILTRLLEIFKVFLNSKKHSNIYYKEVFISLQDIFNVSTPIVGGMKKSKSKKTKSKIKKNKRKTKKNKRTKK